MAASGIDQAISLIQTQAVAVTGIASAPTALADYPTNIQTASLPLVLTHVGPATVTIQTSSATPKYLSDRRFMTTCYINPVGQDRTPERIADSATYLERMIDRFVLNRHLADGYQMVEVMSDTGITTGDDIVTTNAQWLFVNGKSFTGFVLELRLKQMMIPE